MTKEQHIKIQRCIDDFYSNRPPMRDKLGAALQVLYEVETEEPPNYYERGAKMYEMILCRDKKMRGMTRWKSNY